VKASSPPRPGSDNDELQALIEEGRQRTRRRRRRNGALVTIAAVLVVGIYLLETYLLDNPKQARAREGLPAAVAGCGVTKIDHGPIPAWTAPAFSDSSSRTPPWPHAVSEHGDVVAVVFGYPLRAGRPTNPANKVLWIMRLPRNGSPLTIKARPLHAKAPLVTIVAPADSSPGEIYPSYVSVPSAGCWRLSLRWAGHTDSIDLPYRPISPT
jgi:hypothetical protein